ncbi:DNA-binding transcriptional MerR regulator [Kaistia dalseonensis]|uniref:DNA-binding transcriptional MerR regulator n=1 Tax=Kaistia dalseonensis TaxID=410840 RepID=A0ABU0H3Z2_9HYPH|nr:DNA-binding transcriptional MerR regulator [Kaistia dalseonensis]
MSKGPDAFRTISEVAEELDLPQHVLRFWETRFTQIRPMKRGGGRRYYRPDDVELLRGIRKLLYGEGYTIKGVQRILKEQGPRHVVAAGQGASLDPVPVDGDDDTLLDAVPDGILADEDGDDFAIAPRAPEPRGARRDPLFDPPGRGDAHHREPEFLDRRRDAGPAPAVRAEPRPVEPATRGRLAPEPAVSLVSRLPAAPPDEPESADDYLPPLVAETPAPPDRVRGAIRAEEPSRHATFEDRREPSLTSTRPVPIPRETDPHPVVERANLSPSQRQPAHVAPQPTGPALSHDDIRTLRAALADLLECKRILDQAR